MHQQIKTTLIFAAYGGLFGLVGAGVWAVDRAPEPAGRAYFITDDSDSLSFSPPGYPFTGAGVTNFEPLPEPRLPVPLWLAIPLTTTSVGAVAGVIAAAAGLRFSRDKTH